MGEHCTLGDAGGATRVLQHGEILSVENHGAIGRFGTLAEHIVELQCPRDRKLGHHPLHVLDQKVNQRSLGLRVQVGNLGHHDRLYPGAWQHGRGSLGHVGLHNHYLNPGIV